MTWQDKSGCEMDLVAVYYTQFGRTSTGFGIGKSDEMNCDDDVGKKKEGRKGNKIKITKDSCAKEIYS